METRGAGQHLIKPRLLRLAALLPLSPGPESDGESAQSTTSSVVVCLLPVPGILNSLSIRNPESHSLVCNECPVGTIFGVPCFPLRSKSLTKLPSDGTEQERTQ